MALQKRCFQPLPLWWTLIIGFLAGAHLFCCESEMRSIIVFGWPATGKTTSGQILAQRYKVSHYDLEKEPQKETAAERGFHRAWDDLANFVRADFLQTIAVQPCVVTAGVNGECYPVLNALARCRQEAGAIMFWLHGDARLLRPRWIEKQRRNGATDDVRIFDAQASRLSRYEPMWKSVCGQTVFDATSEGMTTERLAEEIATVVDRS